MMEELILLNIQKTYLESLYKKAPLLEKVNLYLRIKKIERYLKSQQEYDNRTNKITNKTIWIRKENWRSRVFKNIKTRFL